MGVMKIKARKLFNIIRTLSLFNYSNNIGTKNKIHWTVRVGEDCSIGDHNYIGKGCGIDNAILKSYCSIAPNVQIGPGMHSLKFLSTSQLLSKEMINHKLVYKKTYIDNDVWLGVNSVLIQGVTIGQGAVVGANSVVTKNVPAYAIVGGVPAKIIKYRFNEKEIKYLLTKDIYRDTDKKLVLKRLKECLKELKSF
jgi:virginiamycin A acetyltransferase